MNFALQLSPLNLRRLHLESRADLPKQICLFVTLQGEEFLTSSKINWQLVSLVRDPRQGQSSPPTFFFPFSAADASRLRFRFSLEICFSRISTHFLSFKMRWRGTVLLLLAALTSLAQSQCPANTFTCADGSCIPSDWRGDGEKDCEDGSDETGGATAELPFDEVVLSTPATAESPSSEEETTTTTATATDDGDCKYVDQQKIDGCSERTISFLHDIEQLSMRNSSLLWHEQLQAQIERGCNLTNEYADCVRGTSSETCMPDEGVRSWREVEMFVCQLLLPTAREHSKCFNSLKASPCANRSNQKSSTLCRLINSARSDVECLQSTKPADCSEEALEMLAPIHEEAVHVVEAIRCQGEPEAPQVVDDTAEASTETTTVEGAEDEDKPELTINMADAVNSLYYIYDICSSNYSGNAFASIAGAICARQDDIAKHSDCYQKTLEKEKCAVRNASTSCEALSTFNNNLDCAIVTMNDECSVDAQNLVVELQEDINDIIIKQKCFDDAAEEKEAAKSGGDDKDFKLNPTLPKCKEEQENAALGCLVELVEINKKLSQFHNLNFLLELASPNSTVVDGVCELFGKYEQCLQTSVFSAGQRCSFASPLNSLARIGLAPICSLDSRPMLSRHRSCLKDLADQTTKSTDCQSGLAELSGSVQMMLQGIHGEALLCKSFYVIREAFSCGERAIQEKCGTDALNDLLLLKTKMTALGEEEGCPREKPANLEEIIARPVVRQPVTLPPRDAVDRAPTAHGLRPTPAPPVPIPAPTPAVNKACTAEQQNLFEDCVRPLTAFQPHPLSVIAVPRDIDQACEAFATFKKCTAENECHPLWAKGMGAMFEYACNEASAQFKEVRKCIRETAAKENVKTCVSEFSRGAPTHACLSSNKLLTCAISELQTSCGSDAVNWVSSYVTRFATAIDPRCKIASQLPVGRVVGVGCSPEEEAIIDHCAAPLNDIGQRVEDLFAGGMQSLIKNINSLAPVFAGGCNLTEEFKTCAQFILSGRTPCVVSSCFIEAGKAICDKPDPTKAIDDNLSCFFGQIQEPNFAKCVRGTLSTVKQFTLSNIRNVLPKFIDCTEDIVRAKCGESPIQVLRAMSSPDLCVVGKAASGMTTRLPPQQVQPKLAVCDEETKKSYEVCTKSFFEKFGATPSTLLKSMSDSMVCTEAKELSACSSAARLCSATHESAFVKTVSMNCEKEAEERQRHGECVASAAASAECPTITTTPNCETVKQTIQCFSAEIITNCGQEALTFATTVVDTYAKLLDASCSIPMPEVTSSEPSEASTEATTTTTSSEVPTTTSTSSEMECGEDGLVEYLQCESLLDQYAFRPISIIGNASQWDEFCSMFNATYRPCISALKCKFEPAAPAQVQLLDSICNRVVTLRDQKKFAPCLSDLTRSQDGLRCMGHLADVDNLSKTASAEMCTGLNEVMKCAAEPIEKKCGFDALLHVFDLHTQWATLYNATCVLESPQPKEITNEVEPSRDTKPVVVQKDETTPPPTTTTELSNRIDENLDAAPATSPPVAVASRTSLLSILPVLALLLVL
ncbi:unnamed protein product [Caenorhabditis auriculariae]|uniref:DUF19 domain-containing protein n=1 Tax=Caenorhabditis auriculariae TaxID=2777116 RepID=A0A8S1GZ56_9PELO|nr:unnamed protein product [Caenorhabditis auriculariae]